MEIYLTLQIIELRYMFWVIYFSSDCILPYSFHIRKQTPATSLVAPLSGCSLKCYWVFRQRSFLTQAALDEQAALPEHIPRLGAQSPSAWQSLKDSLSLDPLQGGRATSYSWLALGWFLPSSLAPPPSRNVTVSHIVRVKGGASGK